jgi:hypothetical protein
LWISCGKSGETLWRITVGKTEKSLKTKEILAEDNVDKFSTGVTVCKMLWKLSPTYVEKQTIVSTYL